MPDEIDLDAFLGFDEPDPEVAAAIEAAQREITIGEAGPETVTGVDRAQSHTADITAIVFRSQRDGPGHVVAIVDGGPGIGRYVQCNCAATRSLGHRPRGCWAMEFTRDLVGITQPEGR